MQRIDIRGQDSLGQFRLSLTRACGVCGAKPALTLRYSRLALPLTIGIGDTILSKAGGATGTDGVGVTCGCYGKLHRQVAHIMDSMRARDH